MFRPTQIAIPTLVRVKPGALDRVGIYLSRDDHRRVAVLVSHGLVPSLQERLRQSLADSGIEAVTWTEVEQNDVEFAAAQFLGLPKSATAIVGIGGGKALDVAKYVAFLARRPFCAVPTSLSNDGFCSPNSSLTVRGRRCSMPSALPRGVVVDTGVCREAPRVLTLSGVGDLMAKFTAVRDWKLAFHATGEPVDDFAALLSDGSIHAFRSHPAFDEEGIHLLATGLLMNGISMEIAGSSRPASGSEHLISHALDVVSSRPRLHGLQVGVASYLVSHLQGENVNAIADLLEVTGFWQMLAEDPFLRSEWREAIQQAPSMKENYHTILSDPNHVAEACRILEEDPRLEGCFRE